MMPRGAPPARQLVPLVAVVLAVHAVVLQLPPDAITPASPQPPRVFATRQIAPPPRPPAAAPAPAVAPAPRPAAAPTPQTVRQPAAEAPAPVAEAPAEPSLPAVLPSDVEHSHLTPPPNAVRGVPPHPVVIPAPARVHYEAEVNARGLSVTGKAELQWRTDGEGYEARMEIGTPLLPKRVQHSAGRITSEGLAPSRFSDRYRNEEATHFEREKGKVVFSNNRPEAELAAGAQDRLSVVVQLAAMVAGNPVHYPVGSTIAIPTAGTRESETWVFTVVGEEDLQLPGGRLRGLKLQRLPRKEFDTTVELWLAPRLDYAPVRLRLTYANGDSLDLRWSSTDKG